jgi:hypothetical protein
LDVEALTKQNGVRLLGKLKKSLKKINTDLPYLSFYKKKPETHIFFCLINRTQCKEPTKERNTKLYITLFIRIYKHNCLIKFRHLSSPQALPRRSTGSQTDYHNYSTTGALEQMHHKRQDIPYYCTYF